MGWRGQNARDLEAEAARVVLPFRERYAWAHLAIIVMAAFVIFLARG
jgi:hypothetical protein